MGDYADLYERCHVCMASMLYCSRHDHRLRCTNKENSMMVSRQSWIALLGIFVAGASLGWPGTALAQWSASDVVNIDHVERSVEARYGLVADSDSTSGTSVASWFGQAFATNGISSFARQYASAEQSFAIDSSGHVGSCADLSVRVVFASVYDIFWKQLLWSINNLS